MTHILHLSFTCTQHSNLLLHQYILSNRDQLFYDSPVIVDDSAGLLHALLHGRHTFSEPLLHALCIKRRAALTHVPAGTHTVLIDKALVRNE